MHKHTTKSAIETQKLGEDFAREILAKNFGTTAVILALSGDLGAGKTTFLQGFAKGLGITEHITSPTFVVIKRVALKAATFKNFYHIDCYRLHGPEDMEPLGFSEIISNPEHIVAIEWAERISDMLPKEVITIEFKHIDDTTRELTIPDFSVQ
jgi:tRNA threonylcarbamoyladenosine biosynthesis protein TsaE